MNIIIVGAVAAGSKAAAKIKRLLPNASVKIFTNDTHISYSSCGLPYFIEGNFTDYKALLVRSPDEFRASGIDVYLEANVEKIYVDQSEILVSLKDGLEVFHYDRLILATGAYPYLPKIEGINNFENIYTLRRIEDGINIRNKMLTSKKAIILGSGYIGLEVFEAFVRNGIEVTLIEYKDKIMPLLDAEMSDILRERIESSNVGNFRIITDDFVEKIYGVDAIATGVKTNSGLEIDTDMIVVCTGVRPNVELAVNAGIELGITGAIKVDKLMRTSAENIYACGDCVEKIHIISGKPVWIPLGSTANKEGRCAAMNAGGTYCEFDGVLGSSVTRCLNTTISMTGLTENDALKLGFTPVSAIISKQDMVGYMPDAGEITLKVVADKITGLLLGGQAIGAIGADKRINALTGALLGHLTVSEYSNNDLTYSPPYSPTIDPLLNAMQILCSKLSKSC